jgi:hypothetical protein
MSKNNGTRNKNSTIIQYGVGDNDFYWLNCEDCSYFFVIPEKTLMDKGLIGNNGITRIANNRLVIESFWRLAKRIYCECRESNNS